MHYVCNVFLFVYCCSSCCCANRCDCRLLVCVCDTQVPISREEVVEIAAEVRAEAVRLGGEIDPAGTLLFEVRQAVGRGGVDGGLSGWFVRSERENDALLCARKKVAEEERRKKEGRGREGSGVSIKYKSPTCLLPFDLSCC